jgi:hypothetical protein
MLTRHSIVAAVLLGVAALLSRFTFRDVETRVQLLVFWGIVVVYHLVLRMVFARPLSRASAAIHLVVVSVAIVGMKVAIEGLPWQR